MKNSVIHGVVSVILTLSLLIPTIMVPSGIAQAATVPTVETRPASSISQTTASLIGRIVSDGGSAILERRFDWGRTISCADGWTASVGVSGDYFAYYLTGLKPGTTYYFRAWAKNSMGWTRGSVLSFTTSRPTSTPLSFTSLTPSSIETSESTYDATLTALGTNFNNVNQITFTWSGPDSGTQTWSRGSSTWNSRVNVISDTYMTFTPRVLYNAGGSQTLTWSWTVTLRDTTGAMKSQYFTVRYVPPTTPLSFTSLTPSSIETSESTYDATLTALGTNFNNVNQITFTWSGPDSGTQTWSRGSSTWNSRVNVISDTYMTFTPRVLYNAGGSQTLTWSWTVTLRDTTGAMKSQYFTVTYSPTETVSTPSRPSGPTSGTVGTYYTYTTGGSASSLGHPVQYYFDWGDGTNSGWLPLGVTSATKSWSLASADGWAVKSRARCATHTSVVSGWSNPLIVSISMATTLSFTDLDPPTIVTSDSTHYAELTAAGTNFNNVNQITFTWSGPDSGTETWSRGTSIWNSRVTVDSDTSMTLRPRVLYNASGSETLIWIWTVTLSDTIGATASQSFIVTYETSPNQPPFASFTFSPLEPKAGDLVTFNASSSFDLDDNILFYEWDWYGNGIYDERTSYAQTTSWWLEDGEYDVTLTVTDDQGLSSNYSANIFAGVSAFSKINEIICRINDWPAPWEEEHKEFVKIDGWLREVKSSKLPGFGLPKNSTTLDWLSDTEFDWCTEADVIHLLKMSVDNDLLEQTMGIELQGSSLSYGEYATTYLEEERLVHAALLSATPQPLIDLQQLLDFIVSKDTAFWIGLNIVKYAHPVGNLVISMITMAKTAISAKAALDDINDQDYLRGLAVYFREIGTDPSGEEDWDEARKWVESSIPDGASSEERDLILEATHSYFRDLWEQFLGGEESWKVGRLVSGLTTPYRYQARQNLKALLVAALERHSAEIKNRCTGTLHSPGELRVIDSYGRVTGYLNATQKEDIPFSVYDQDNNQVIIIEPSGTLIHQVLGTSDGEYSLELASVENGIETEFTANCIPITTGEVNNYTVDWDALAQGELGITIHKDFDGDGEVDETILTGVPETPADPSPSDGATSASVNATLIWTGNVSGLVTYDVYFGTDINPPLVSERQAETSYLPALNLTTTYYWQVVAINEHGITSASELWSFTTRGYRLTTSSSDGGSVITPGEDIFRYDVGETVGLVAEADEGYRFVGWTGDVATTADVNAANTTITMNGHYSITANFLPEGVGPIWDWYDLNTIRNNLSCNYILMNDLDSATAGYEELASPMANGGKGWQPIGTLNDEFTGTFNGQGYEIKDLVIDRPDEDYVGLFGYVRLGGVIQDIRVVSAVVSGFWYVGGLVGYNGWDSIASNSYSSGSVTGDHYVGGLVGYNDRGKVSNSYFSGRVTGIGSVGGLIGDRYWGTVDNSYSSGNVTGVSRVGGLLGNNRGIVNNSYSTCSVTGSDDEVVVTDTVGGLVGMNLGGSSVTNCHSSGTVTAVGSFVGGLVGRNMGNVTDSYSTGSVTGWSCVGGLAGYNQLGIVTDSRSSGNVTGFFDVGGLVGENWDGTVSNSYSSGNVTGSRAYVGGLVGTNTFSGTVKNSHYNYDEVLINGENVITIGALFDQDFKRWLGDDKFLDVSERLSIEDDYYLINNVSDFKQLLAFGQDDSLRFRLKNDLDLGNEPNLYIPYLVGEFDGNGYKISSLSFNFDFVSQVGLFGYIAYGGKVSNAGLESVNITGHRWVGGLVGYCFMGTVSNSYSSGSVTGVFDVGGLAGMNYQGTVSNSYATGNVTGDSGVGGLMGENYNGRVSKCYSTGKVDGRYSAGGLIGSNNYHVSNSFWDTETSRQATSAGGTAKTTMGMQDITTFTDTATEGLDEPWDMTAVSSGETNPAHTWNIIDGESYPFLSWQIPETWYVDDDLADYPTADFTRIQDAVDAASSGDTIIVLPGTYIENVDVYRSHLTIRSQNGAEVTIVQAANSDDHVFEVIADYVNIDGFTLTGASGVPKAGVYLAENISRCNILGSKAIDNYLGIYAFYDTDNAIINNDAGSNDNGIRLEGSSNDELRNNNVSNTTSGLSGITLLWASGNQLTQNTGNFNGGAGILLISSSNNELCSNTVSNNWFGIYLQSSSNNHLADNVANGNNETGLQLDTASNNNTLTNNIVSEESWSNLAAGICVKDSSTDNALLNNTVSNNYYGIKLLFSGNNTITHNDLSENWYGVFLAGSSSDRIYLNNFIQNTVSAAHSPYWPSSDIWNSPETITYNYNGNTYTNYLGNYWGDYTGSDADADGIGDTPYPINADADNYPLVQPFENYELTPPTANLSLYKSDGWGQGWLHFDLTVSNDGPAAAENVTVVDALPWDLYFDYASDKGIWSEEDRTVTWYLGTVEPDTSRYLSLDVSCPYWIFGENRASVNTTTAESSYEDNEAVGFYGSWPEHHFDLCVSGPSGAAQGDEIMYSLSYENLCWDWDAENVQIIDSLAPQVSFVSASDGGTYADGAVTWHLGTGPLDYGEVTLTVKVADDAPIGSEIVNTAYISSTNEFAYPIDNYTYGECHTTVLKGANLILSKTCSATKDQGSVMTYTIHYQNFGTEPAENVVISDTLPSDVTYVSSSNGGDCPASPGNIVTWNMCSVEGLGHGSVSVTVEIGDSVAVGTVITNQATINSTTPETCYDDNEAVARTEVVAPLLPPNVGVEPNNGGTAAISVNYDEPVTLSFDSCEEATSVDIRIQIDDGGPDIYGAMIEGPAHHWTYTTTFFPRYGETTVTYTVYGCPGRVEEIDFGIYIDPAGYVYDVITGLRVESATVWLQQPDGLDEWENVPTGATPANMNPDINPLVTGADGQYQWDVLAGSYRVHVEAAGYYSSDSVVVSIPPPATDLHIGLIPLNQPPVADAGPDQTVCAIAPNMTAMVTLDGSGSYDPDGDPLTYNWTWDGNTAYGVSPTVELAAGNTTITLVVNDGKVDSQPDTVDVTVLIPATIDFEPDVLNLEAKGKYITAYIELPSGYNVSQIDITSIKLNDTVPALAKPTELGDYDKDGTPDFMVKFHRSAVKSILTPGSQVEITITGEVAGIAFEGSDTIRVISK